MSNIDTLLRRHYEGIITPEEQSELDSLTHRDQVIKAATQRAKVLRHRQLASAIGIASVLLIAGGIFIINSSTNPLKSDKPLMAQASVPAVSVVETSPSSVHSTVSASESPQGLPAVQESKSAMPEPQPIPKQEVGAALAQSVEDEVADEIAPTVLSESDPIVACNTACSPDSVINDIWKFLRT